MKKLLISLNLIILTLFFTTNFACCEEDFFNSNFKDAKSQSKLEQKVDNVTKKVKKRLSRKEKKQLEEQKGYYGTLPDIKEAFKYKTPTSATSSKTNAKVYDSDTIPDESLKPAPTNDALFLDIVVKKEKASNYVNDIQRTKTALMNLKKCIEENGAIQRFNGCVNLVDLYSKNLEEKYQNKSESLKESYISILNTNNEAKILGNLMFDANYYAKYIPTSTGQYSKDNIISEQEKLLNKINKTLFLINEEK